MTADRCRIVDVDGTPVRVRGARPLTDADREALAAVVDAVLRRADADPDRDEIEARQAAAQARIRDRNRRLRDGG